MGSGFPRRLPGRFLQFAPISYVSPQNRSKFDPIYQQALVLVRAVFLNDLVFLGDQFRPTDRHMHRRQARIAGMGGIVDEVGGIDQVLGGQAPPIGSGTADRAKFGHDGAFAEFGSMERRGKGRRAAAQNDQIKLLLGCTHRVILSPTCRYVLVLQFHLAI
jgi:hypothetical protein